jgi:DNA-binding transcriptional ArsR family regulator
MQAFNHPLRVQLLAILRDRESSPSDLSEEIGEELGVVNYHCRKLEAFGMLEIVRERPVRGSTEHFYKATTRPWWTMEEWSKLDPAVKSVATAWTVDKIMQEAYGALSAFTFDSRDERHLSRTPLVLDDEGWVRVGALLDQTLDAVMTEQGAAADRMADSGEEGAPALVAMMQFETPPPPPRSD